jgi:hypothetical protein
MVSRIAVPKGFSFVERETLFDEGSQTSKNDVALDVYLKRVYVELYGVAERGRRYVQKERDMMSRN